MHTIILELQWYYKNHYILYLSGLTAQSSGVKIQTAHALRQGSDCGKTVSK